VPATIAVANTTATNANAVCFLVIVDILVTIHC
jgi:hypothetical protein